MRVVGGLKGCDARSGGRDAGDGKVATTVRDVIGELQGVRTKK